MIIKNPTENEVKIGYLGKEYSVEPLSSTKVSKEVALHWVSIHGFLSCEAEIEEPSIKEINTKEEVKEEVKEVKIKDEIKRKNEDTEADTKEEVKEEDEVKEVKQEKKPLIEKSKAKVIKK